MKTETREIALQSWLDRVFPLVDAELLPLAGDASFRRYFRYRNAEASYVIMDAPPEKENCQTFYHIAKDLLQGGLPVPAILQSDLSAGFLVLTDFGDNLLWEALQSGDPHTLYRQALSVLTTFQSQPYLPSVSLPHFDRDFMQSELMRIEEWYVPHYLQQSFSAEQQRLWQNFCGVILDEIAAQPRVMIHRDYHSRNILVTDQQLGIIDFQDAMMGPLTYDVVSLLKDCYIDWPREKVLAWLAYYHHQAVNQLGVTQTFSALVEDFDIVGLQRHLKCLGIFARLAYRDNKMSYLMCLPRVWNYIAQVVREYPLFEPYQTLIEALKPQRIAACVP